MRASVDHPVELAEPATEVEGCVIDRQQLSQATHSAIVTLEVALSGFKKLSGTEM